MCSLTFRLGTILSFVKLSAANPKLQGCRGNHEFLQENSPSSRKACRGTSLSNRVLAATMSCSLDASANTDKGILDWNASHPLSRVQIFRENSSRATFHGD